LAVPPYREGYDGHWNVADLSSITEDMTVEAIYELKTYTVTWVDEWDHVYHTTLVQHGSHVTLPLEEPVKEGYEFTGYLENVSELVITADTSITVIFTRLAYLVIFRVDGSPVKNEMVSYGQSATAPTVNVEGYVFLEWDKLFDHITEAIEVNAVLTPITYNLTLYANGGVFDGQSDSHSWDAPYQSTINYTANPIRNGYQFSGWYLNEEGTGNPVNLANYTMPLGGLVLYARWEPVAYQITYQHLYGAQNGNPQSYNIVQAFTLAQPTSRVGYDFVGWFDADIDGEAVTGISVGTTGNITLYARWTAKTYPVTYGNLQSMTHGNPLAYTIETPTITLADPENRTGYTFMGWFTALSGGTEVNEISLGSTGAKMVYARWNPISYAIHYENLQGTTQLNPTSYTIETQTIALSAPSARIGYTFAGWVSLLEEGVPITEIPIGSTGDQTVYASWMAKTYEITFATSGGDLIDPMCVTYQQAFSLPVATKTGYTFMGWKYLGNPFTSGTWTGTANITLEAQWSATAYQITFVTLGGTMVDPLTVTVDQAYLLPVTTKTGYTFMGWFLNDVLVENGTWTKTENVTLEAKWTVNHYAINYLNLQGTIHDNPLTYSIDTPTIALENPGTRTGYTFAGWFTAQNGGTEVTEIVSGSTETINVYARWLGNHYTIHFNVLDGDPIADMIVIFDQPFTLPAASREGYSFVGWTREGSPFVSGLWQIAEEITLVAIWTEWPVMSFDSDGGSHVSSISAEPGSAIDEPAEPIREGYTFIAWYEASAPETAYVFTTMPAENTILHAKWIANTYQITFMVNGGVAVDPLTATYDQEYALPVTTKTGYAFAGWILNGEAFENGTWTNTSNLIVEATWTPNTYQITFMPLGGNTINPLIVTYGEAFTLPDTTKHGYTLSGWILDDEAFENGTWNLTKDVSLVANWTVNIYSISYLNLQGTTHDNPLTYNIETPIIELENPNERTGYVFLGWFTDIEGGVEIREIYAGSTGDQIVYAQWNAISYDIAYENLQGTTTSNPTSYTLGSGAIILSSPSARAHYTFAGWYNAQEGGMLVTSIDLALCSDITLYARWTPVNYTITFDIDGTLTTLSLPYMSTISSAHVPSIPTKANYDVIAPTWDENPIGFQVLGDYLFSALYVGNPLIVMYDTGDGSPIVQDTVSYGMILPYPDIPTKNGYRFVAWYRDVELANIYDFNDMVTCAMTLYAAWERDYYTFEIESIFLKADLYDPMIVGIDPDQPTITTHVINLIYGVELSPVHSYEGYVFDYYEYDGVDYSSLDQLITVVGNRIDEQRIKVYYRKIILTITFAQDPTLFGQEENSVFTYQLYYNDTFSLLDIPEGDRVILRQPGGSVFAVWDQTNYEYMKQNLTVYALYYDTSVKTITFIDRGVIKYIASQINPLDNLEEVIGSESILWTLYRPGYRFVGWFTEEFGGVQVGGTVLFSDFDGSANLYARWESLTRFNAPTNINVVADETQIVISWTCNPATILGVQPAGFEYIFNNSLIPSMTTIPVINGTTFTLTLLSSNPEYALFEDLLNPGTHRLSIRALGDEIHHYHGEFSADKIITNESIFDGNPTEVATYDYFIIETFGETKRYIFYTNLEYQFGSGYTFEMVTGHEYANAEQNKIMTGNLSGAFKFRMIREGYPTVVYDGLVVHDIKQFAHGSNYLAFLNATNSGQTVFLDPATTYYVGAANDFYVDLRMVNNQGTRIPLSQVYLEYDLYVWMAGSYQLIAEDDLEDYIQFLPENRIRMDSSTVGGQYQLVVKPKYQSTAMQVSSLEYTFVVNDGYNVFTNQQLKECFSDFDVTTINIHASFKAELSSAQKNADGSPINVHPNQSNTQSGNGTGNVYLRFSQTIDNDHLIVQGNYMTIDGSELPFSNAQSGSGLVGFAESFEIVSVQIAIFNYSVTNASLAPTNNNQFHVNNLIVKSNTSTPYVDFDGTAEQIEIQERMMSRNSGGYVGFFVEHGMANYTNLVIFNAVIAITNNAYGINSSNVPTYATLDHVYVYNSWANSIYTHGGNGYIVRDSVIGQSGGSSFHLVDIRPFGAGNTPLLDLDDSNTINNWISGEEAWFKAYGMSQVALTLKSGIEGGISGTGRSIIQTVINPINGLETEMINFILLTESSSSAIHYSDPEETVKDSGSEVHLVINEVDIERAFNYLTSGDPRIINEMYGFPVGAYSDVMAFYGLVSDIAARIAPSYPSGTPAETIQAAAASLATLGAFYGLTGEQTVMAYGMATQYAVPFNQAVETLYPAAILPEYIEILAKVPLFPDGSVTVLIQLD
jgi:uncharacterized repeat protein (TIGR02543 family)